VVVVVEHKVVGVVDMKVVDHMLVVVVVEVVVEVAVFRHMQRSNVYNRIIELQHQRRDL
jgi:hypothetical protein